MPNIKRGDDYCEHGAANNDYCRECAHPEDYDYDVWFEVTVHRGKAAFARFGEAVLVTSATVRGAYARSAQEFDCLVGLRGNFDKFREIAKPVHMGRPARPEPQ